jgi:Arc/MetJ-type ribon-helix-helix transcriptional regulator
MADERVTLRLTSQQLEGIDLLVKLGEFDDRSSAIRQAIRELVDSRRGKVLAKMDEVARFQQAAVGATKADEVLRK